MTSPEATAPDRRTAPQQSAAIETRALTKYYGDQLAVDAVDLRVETGEVFGFIGPNGAGKSTTIRMLLDLLRPTSGTASLFGLDAQRDSVEIRRRTGYLPGDLALYRRLRVDQLLRWLGRLRGGVDGDVVRRLAERLGLDLHRTVGDLSTGNRQKVGLVQAFMSGPELLLLDEPTSGLDPLVRSEVRSLIEETRDDGRTVFLSSHVLAEVEEVCDRVAMIRDGRVVLVESLRGVRSSGHRRVTARLGRPAPATTFTVLPGVHDVEVAGDTVSLRAEGPLDALVKELARHEVLDLTSEPLTLEDVFLESYRAGGAAREGPSG